MKFNKDKKDELFIERLELMNSYITQKYQLETLIKSGCLHLAKTRYVDRRPNYISTLQLPTSDSDKETKALYNVKLVEDDTVKDSEKENVNNSNKKETKKSSENKHEGSHFELIKQEDVKENPLRWFGVLVSQSLRSAQTDFQRCISLSVQIANVQLKLKKLEDKLKEER
ncbi:coiled-coil domain-containing protein 115-like [Diaphorina citri]|uniref:Vacuolar ATPase assembly protein VMA22 n=1 Tax=Diaphorina citri TaxID=121845 RepID=A0A1S3CYP1_DIACI|nr:coiled-coil domain-containing protein 115-like [Diaphorina citri]